MLHMSSQLALKCLDGKIYIVTLDQEGEIERDAMVSVLIIFFLKAEKLIYNTCN